MKRKENSMSKKKKKNNTHILLSFFRSSLLCQNGSQSQCLVPGLEAEILIPGLGRKGCWISVCIVAQLFWGRGTPSGENPMSNARQLRYKWALSLKTLGWAGELACSQQILVLPLLCRCVRQTRPCLHAAASSRGYSDEITTQIVCVFLLWLHRIACRSSDP